MMGDLAIGGTPITSSAGSRSSQLGGGHAGAGSGPQRRGSSSQNKPTMQRRGSSSSSTSSVPPPREEKSEGKCAGTGRVPRKATGVSRAKVWNLDVENAFRVQNMGWRDIDDYLTVHEYPEVHENNLYRKVLQKDTGHFSYWRAHRELAEAKLHLVKLYTY